MIDVVLQEAVRAADPFRVSAGVLHTDLGHLSIVVVPLVADNICFQVVFVERIRALEVGDLVERTRELLVDRGVAHLGAKLRFIVLYNLDCLRAACAGLIVGLRGLGSASDRRS